jgi:hypothetical protein
MEKVVSNLQLSQCLIVLTFSEAWNVVQLCLQTLDVTLN